MRVERTKAADGRTLVKVTFKPHDPDPDHTSEVVAVFEAKQAGKLHMMSYTSATTEDTREPVPLTPEQKDAILEAIKDHLADEDDSPLWEDD